MLQHLSFEAQSFWLLPFNLPLVCMQSKKYKNSGYVGYQDYFHVLGKTNFIKLQFQSNSYLYCHLKFYSVLILGVFSNTNNKIFNFEKMSLNSGGLSLCCFSSDLQMSILLSIFVLFSLKLLFLLFLLRTIRNFFKILHKLHVATYR